MARDINIRIGASNQASAVLSRVRGDVTGLERASQRLAAGLKTMGVAFAAAGAASAAAGFGLAIKTASAAQETLSKFQVVFGENAGEMKKWSDANARALGTSDAAMQGMLSGLQDLFVPMGVSSDLATDMSKTLSTLAVDLGSFNNIETDRVMTDLMAAMTGSGETMKKYGVIVSEAAVKQELLNMKLDPKKIGEAEKAQARLNIIMRGTTAAQGDAIRTAGGFANSLKRLKSQVDNLLAVLGTPFLDGLANLMQSWGAALQGMTDSIAAADWDGAMRIAMLSMKVEVLRGLDEIEQIVRTAVENKFQVGLTESWTLMLARFGHDVASGGGFKALQSEVNQQLQTAIADAAIKAGRDSKVTEASKSLGAKIGTDIGNAITTGLNRTYKPGIDLAIKNAQKELEAIFGKKRPVREFKKRELHEINAQAEMEAIFGKPKKKDLPSLQATQGRLLTGRQAGDDTNRKMLQEMQRQNAKNVAFQNNVASALGTKGWNVTIADQDTFTMEKVG